MVFKNDEILKKIVAEKDAQPYHIPTMDKSVIIAPGKPTAAGIDATTIVCELYRRYFQKKYY